MSVTADTPPLSEGDIVADKYRVERVLGRGGMGVVIAATHIQLGKRVALKMMLPEALGLRDGVERFEREARAAVRLRSEHVAQLLDVGVLPNGAPYIVMEFLEGHELGSIVAAGGGLPVDVAIDIVLQTCEAVAEAHVLGIVHRDLKPSNVFLTHRVDGSALVKVLDFGISKWTPDDSDTHSLTRTNDVMGSPNYMSPEQIRSSKTVDARTDIWSLGVILYELLSGRVPFVAESVPQLCSQVLEDQPVPLTAIRPDVSPLLWSVVARCLEKSRDRRYPTVHALVEALAVHAPPQAQISVSRVRGISSHPPARSPLALSSGVEAHAPHSTSIPWTETLGERGRRKRKAVWVAAGVVLASAGAFASYQSVRRDGATTHSNAPDATIDSLPMASATARGADAPGANVRSSTSVSDVSTPSAIPSLPTPPTLSSATGPRTIGVPARPATSAASARPPPTTMAVPPSSSASAPSKPPGGNAPPAAVSPPADDTLAPRDRK